jgi:hypothetical protein
VIFVNEKLIIILLDMVIHGLLIFAGGLFINWAIDNFKEKHYFRFGLDAMFVLYYAISLVKSI